MRPSHAAAGLKHTRRRDRPIGACGTNKHEHAVDFTDRNTGAGHRYKHQNPSRGPGTCHSFVSSHLVPALSRVWGSWCWRAEMGYCCEVCRRVGGLLCVFVGVCPKPKPAGATRERDCCLKDVFFRRPCGRCDWLKTPPFHQISQQPEQSYAEESGSQGRV